MKRSSKGLGPASPKEGTRERLLAVTIDEIERRGISNLTVRSVAEAAGANLAAVNYHFRSKDALVAEALSKAMQSFVENCDSFLASIPADAHAGVVAFLSFLLDGSRRFPGIVRAFLHAAFAAQDYTGPFPKAFVPIATRFRDLLCAAVPGLDRASAGRRTVAALSSALFPAFFGGLFPGLGPLGSAADLRDYFREVASTALMPAGRDHPRRQRVRRRA